jgi:hypothetical protein
MIFLAARTLKVKATVPLEMAFDAAEVLGVLNLSQ